MEPYLTNCMFLKLERVTRRFADNFKHVSLMPKINARPSTHLPELVVFVVLLQFL